MKKIENWSKKVLTIDLECDIMLLVLQWMWWTKKTK